MPWTSFSLVDTSRLWLALARIRMTNSFLEALNGLFQAAKRKARREVIAAEDPLSS